MNQSSKLLIFTDEPALAGLLEGWIAPFGWQVRRMDMLLADPSPVAASPAPAIVLVDGRSRPERVLAVLRHIRGLPGPQAGVPILLCAPADGPDVTGVNDRIDLPMEEAICLEALQLWAGPLADHGYRDITDPRYRLTRLAGSVRADALMDNFAESLSAALDQIAQGGDLRKTAHQIVGMAGTIGYDQLGKAWTAVDRGVDDALEPARIMAENVLRSLRKPLAETAIK
jgi:hypothetical protein